MVTEWKGGPEVEEFGSVGKTVEVEPEEGTDLGAEMGGVAIMGMEAGVREAVGMVLEADGEGSEDLVFLGVVSSGSFAALACFFFLSVAHIPVESHGITAYHREAALQILQQAM